MLDSQRTQVCRLAAVGLLAVSTSAWAASSPLELIRSAVTRVTAVLENSASHGEAQQQERIKQVWAIVEPYFDLRDIAQRTLGVHWHERTEEERPEFVRLFTALIEKTYSSTLTRYTSDVQFAFDGQRSRATSPRLIPGSSIRPSIRLFRFSISYTRWEGNGAPTAS